MSEPADDQPVSPTRTPSTSPDTTSVEAYRVEDRTVLHDAQNPLAWIESSRTIRLTDAT